MAPAQPSRSLVYAVGARRRRALAVCERPPADPARPRLLDRVRAALRTRDHSRRTDEAYVAWIRRYIFVHGKRHPVELAGPEVTRLLSARPMSLAARQFMADGIR